MNMSKPNMDSTKEQPEISARAMTYNKLTPETTILGLRQLAQACTDLARNMENILEKTEPLEFNEWYSLYDWAKRVYADCGFGFTARYMFYMVLKRGFKDALAALEKIPEAARLGKRTQENDDFIEWYIVLSQAIESERVYHLNPAVPADRLTLIELTDGLLPVVQLWKSEVSLRKLAQERFPDDQVAVELFVKANKNW
jgi:hypothetical protein